MNNISIQTRYKLEDFKKAENGLVDIYDWLSQSPVGTDSDLQAVNLCLEVIGSVIFQLMRSPNE